jgi:AraC-like DNA-binding protein
MLQKSITVGVVTVPGNTPGLFVQKLLNVVAQHDDNVAEFWRQSQTRQQLPPNTQLSEVEFSYEQYVQLVQEILDSFEISGLGLRIGRRSRISDFGILGYALLSARTLESALKLAVQFQLLWGGGIHLITQLYSEGDLAIWEEQSKLPPGRLQQFQLEDAVAQFLSARELLAEPDRFKLSKIDFSFPAPDYAHMFEETFGCPIRFDQPKTRAFFPRRLLDSKLGAANPLVQEVCEKQCTRLLRTIEDRGGLTEKVRAIILHSPGDIPQLQEVAKKVNMSLRTVRRRLESENTTYKNIVADVRMKMAKQYLLETPFSIKQIGYLLCYSDVANFQRAFKNWYDTTPRKMRLQHTVHD